MQCGAVNASCALQPATTVKWNEPQRCRLAAGMAGFVIPAEQGAESRARLVSPAGTRSHGGRDCRYDSDGRACSRRPCARAAEVRGLMHDRDTWTSRARVLRCWRGAARARTMRCMSKNSSRSSRRSAACMDATCPAAAASRKCARRCVTAAGAAFMPASAASRDWYRRESTCIAEARHWRMHAAYGALPATCAGGSPSIVCSRNVSAPDNSGETCGEASSATRHTSCATCCCARASPAQHTAACLTQ